MERLSGWLVTDEGGAVIGAEGLVTLLDTWFGDRDLWRDDDHGLARALDETPGWSGWDSWNRTEKIENLRVLLETERDRAAVIPPDDELAVRLTQLWGGDGWRDPSDGGLASSLDQLPGWESWATTGSLTLPVLREWLTPLPAEWTEVPADPGEPARDAQLGRWRDVVDGAAVFFHDADQVWERVDPPDSDPAQAGITPGIHWARYHEGMGEWLPYKERTKEWLDRGVGKWRRYEQVGVREPQVAFDQSWQLYYRMVGDTYEFSLDGAAGWTADPYSLRPPASTGPVPAEQSAEQSAEPSPGEAAAAEESTEVVDDFVAKVQARAQEQGLSLTEDEILEFLEGNLSDQPG